MRRRRILYRIFLTLAYMVAIVPLWFHYLVSDAVSWIAFRLRLYRYNIIHDNLTRSFPEKNEREIRSIIREYYRHLLDCTFETFKLLTISDRAIDRRVKVEGVESMRPAVEAGKPIILYMGHVGNWEWVPAITHHYTRPEVSAQIFRYIKDPVANDITMKIRSRFGSLNIPQQQAFRTLMRLKQEGKQTITGFIADQRPNGANLNHWITFLNQDTPYAVGRRGDRPAHRRRLHIPRHREDRPRPLPADHEADRTAEGYDYPYTASFMAMLERTIRRQPPTGSGATSAGAYSAPQRRQSPPTTIIPLNSIPHENRMCDTGTRRIDPLF